MPQRNPAEGLVRVGGGLNAFRQDGSGFSARRPFQPVAAHHDRCRRVRSGAAGAGRGPGTGAAAAAAGSRSIRLRGFTCDRFVGGLQPIHHGPVRSRDRRLYRRKEEQSGLRLFRGQPASAPAEVADNVLLAVVPVLETVRAVPGDGLEDEAWAVGSTRQHQSVQVVVALRKADRLGTARVTIAYARERLDRSSRRLRYKPAEVDLERLFAVLRPVDCLHTAHAGHRLDRRRLYAPCAELERMVVSGGRPS